MKRIYARRNLAWLYSRIESLLPQQFIQVVNAQHQFFAVLNLNKRLWTIHGSAIGFDYDLYGSNPIRSSCCLDLIQRDSTACNYCLTPKRRQIKTWLCVVKLNYHTIQKTGATRSRLLCEEAEQWTYGMNCRLLRQSVRWSYKLGVKIDKALGSEV